MDPSDEIFDVVDSEDRVIGRASRAEVHSNGLLHRAVHILVFNDRGDLFLQKRALSKDENPGLWDSSAAGHVNSGEDYLSCAHRELMEELGIGEELEFGRKFSACPDTLWENIEIYHCRTAKKIVINPEEISEGRFWSRRALEDGLQQDPRQFTSTFRLIFNEFFKSKRFNSKGL